MRDVHTLPTCTHGNHHIHHGIQCCSSSHSVFPCRCVVWYRTRGVFIHSCAPWCVCYRHLRSLLSSSGMLVCSTDSQYHGTAHLSMLHPHTHSSMVSSTWDPSWWCGVCTTEMLAARRHTEYDCVRIHVLCCCQISSPRLLLLTVTIQLTV